MGRFLGYSFGSVLSSFVAHWSRSNFVKGLNNNAVLSVGLQVRDLQMVFLAVFHGEINSLVGVEFVGGREFVANVVSQNLAIPVFACWWFPCNLFMFMLLL